jgi:flagellar basal-body rod protein FlgG
MDVTANNLANVNTTGYKKSRAEFQDLLYQTIRASGTAQAQNAIVPVGVQVGLGAKYVATQKIFTPGDIQSTDNPLDMMIKGNGFFEVQMPDGTSAYTRDGTFKRDANGSLVTSDGYKVQPEITVPAGSTDISVGEDGTISANSPGQTQRQQLGQLKLVNFLNSAGLKNNGQNLYSATDSSGDPVTDVPGQNGLGTIINNSLEMSNVKIVDEMVNMILAQRAYEVNSKSIQAADEMLTTANNLRR